MVDEIIGAFTRTEVNKAIESVSSSLQKKVELNEMDKLIERCKERFAKKDFVHVSIALFDQTIPNSNSTFSWDPVVKQFYVDGMFLERVGDMGLKCRAVWAIPTLYDACNKETKFIRESTKNAVVELAVWLEKEE